MDQSKTLQDKKHILTVEELSRQMLEKRTTIPVFRWRLKESSAINLLTAAYMAEVKLRNRQFVDTAEVRKNIGDVARALVSLGHPKFGIVMCGQCGNGKSTMLAAMQTATNYLSENGYFTEHYQGFGDYKQDVFFHKIDTVALTTLKEDAFKKFSMYNIVGLEDLGAEPKEVLSYGNVLTPVKTLLESRYAMGLTTFITTNLAPTQIEPTYGKRIADRFREMMFSIPFDNPSFRLL